jgi:hypothetical protein
MQNLEMMGMSAVPVESSVRVQPDSVEFVLQLRLLVSLFDERLDDVEVFNLARRESLRVVQDKAGIAL